MKIMDSGATLSSMDLTRNARMISRRQPLHTCGVSILAIAHKAYTKARDFNGPKGSAIKKIETLASLASPIVYAMQYQWLAILSFVDDHILAAEKMIEFFFPNSSRLFNTIDELVLAVETLPSIFDHAMNIVPVIIHQVPFLDLILVRAISWLNFLVSMLTYWGSNNTREKEIMIDINYPVESPSDVDSDNVRPNSSSISDFSVDKTKTIGSPNKALGENFEKSCPVYDSLQCEGMEVSSDAIKCSYKEILEKGTNENIETKDSEVIDEKEESVEEIAIKDPILELFEASWHMKPEGVSRSSTSRSVS